MVQIPILSGITTDNGPDLRQTFPVNLAPFGLGNGVSNGYLRPAEGVVRTVTGPGEVRGLYASALKFTGLLFFVGGTRFCSVDESGNITTLGTVADGGPIVWAEDFNVIAIASGGFLYYWDGSTLDLVTDVDVGVVNSVAWQGGYFLVTDGEKIRRSEITDRMSFTVFDFAVPESSPDPVVALLRVRNEIVAVGANTVEVFVDVGGTGFAFQAATGAQLQKGCVGTWACCVFLDAVAFVGGAKNEQPGIYVGSNGQTRKLSTRSIDLDLAALTEGQLQEIVLEARIGGGQNLLYVHLPDRTLVFDADASEPLGTQAWSTRSSSRNASMPEQYRARFFTWCFNRWNVGDPTGNSLGYLDDTIGSHFGDVVGWQFSTLMLYNAGKGALVDQLELVALPGRVAVDTEARISTSYSLDGMTWSADETIDAGGIGDRRKRLQWRRQGRWNNVRMQRFRGDSATHVSFLRLEANVTPLAW